MSWWDVGRGVSPASLLLFAALGTAQLLPPPRDGDIRTAYWELQNVTDVWLTLEPRSAGGKRAPLLTFTHRFQGRRAARPPADIVVRAFAGQFWAPRGEIWFQLGSGRRVDLPASPDQMLGELPGEGVGSWSASMSVTALRQLAEEPHVTGNALGFAFEWTAAQRKAIQTFLDRVTSGS